MTIYDISKIAIISDLHCGIHSNSELWHKVLIDYGKWLKTELDKKQIKDLFFLGDIFHDREEIGVNTLSVCEQFFKIFSDPIAPYNIVLLTGNHDAYLRDSSQINSISIFKGWPNITIIDDIFTINIKKRNFTFIPWGCKPEDCPKSDIMFGHFEINSFKMNVQKVCEHGIDSEVLLDKAPLIFTGHFHTKDERVYPNGKIIYTGCPYSQNWGDLGLTKGYFIVDASTNTYEFFENTISPRYYKYNFTEFLDAEKWKEIKKTIANNFIKIQIDSDIDYTRLEKLITVLNALKPLEVSTNFTETNKLTVNTDYEAISLDTKALFLEYIDTLDIAAIKDKVIEEITAIYDKSITKVNITGMN
jgi:DNA repair exonuclease SbcCD nuclease subunit